MMAEYVAQLLKLEVVILKAVVLIHIASQPVALGMVNQHTMHVAIVDAIHHQTLHLIY